MKNILRTLVIFLSFVQVANVSAVQVKTYGEIKDRFSSLRKLHSIRPGEVLGLRKNVQDLYKKNPENERIQKLYCAIMDWTQEKVPHSLLVSESSKQSSPKSHSPSRSPRRTPSPQAPQQQTPRTASSVPSVHIPDSVVPYFVPTQAVSTQIPVQTPTLVQSHTASSSSSSSSTSSTSSVIDLASKQSEPDHTDIAKKLTEAEQEQQKELVAKTAETLRAQEKLAKAKEEVSEKRDVESKADSLFPPAVSVQQETKQKEEDPTSSEVPQHNKEQQERLAKALNHLKDLQEHDSNPKFKKIHGQIIRILEENPDQATALVNVLQSRALISARAICKNLITDAANKARESVSDKEQALLTNEITDAICTTFFTDDSNSYNSSSWLKGVGIGAVVGSAAYGLYALGNVYAGTTKSMLGYQSLKWVGSKLPLFWKGANTLAWKIVLPTIGILTAGALCYGGYLLYKAHKLTLERKQAETRCAAENRTPQDREALLKINQTSRKHATHMGNVIVGAGEVVEKVTGKNPVETALDSALGFKS